MSKIIVHTEVMGPDFSELVLHELNYEWSREVVTLAASEADLPFGMVLMTRVRGIQAADGIHGRERPSLGRRAPPCSSELSA
ncbi:MAG: hypothetical protein ACLUPV_07310 [Bilophila wadsworthia]